MVRKVLITGGAGFIGSHISDLLLDEGFEVVIVDDLSTGMRECVSDNFSLYECDIRSTCFHDIVKQERPDCVIHHAAQVDVARSVESPIYDADINVLGSLNVLEACRLNGVRKVIFASSAAVYGEPKYLPVDEEHPIFATSPYGISKYTVERYLYMYRHMYGLEYTVFRYANVYGPRQASDGEGGVVAIFAERARTGRECVIYGDGEQTRDFVYVKDIARANFLAIDKADGMTINLSSGKETSVNELVHVISEATGGQMPVLNTNHRHGEIRRSVLSNKKARETLDWLPQFELAEGIRALME